MKHKLRKTTRALLLLAIINVVLLSSAILYIRYELEQSLIYNRKNELQRLVTVGIHSIREYRDAYASGELTKEEALKKITDHIRRLTFKDEIQPNYLFMSTYSGIMLVQPYEPQKEGTDQWDLADADGKYIIRELVKKAQEGGGFVIYKYYPPGSARATAKVSYVVGLPEFACYLGTGMYSTDIEESINLHFRRIFILMLIISFVLIVSASIVVAPLYFSMQYIIEKFLSLGNDEVVNKPEVDLSRFKAGSDAYELVEGFADITAKLAEKNEALLRRTEERELLVREMNHRVKNNLQIIISLMHIQLAKHKQAEIREPFLETISRLESISIIHGMLYSKEDYQTIRADSYLRELSEYILHSFGADKRIQYSLTADNSELSADQAVPIGIIVNEAITNAIKYAFEKNSPGRIEISFTRTDGDCRLSIRDNGSGLPEEYINGKESGLGITLINNLAGNLGAELDISNKDGTAYLLKFSC